MTLVSCLFLLAVPIRAEGPQREPPERGVFSNEQISDGTAVVVDLLIIRPLAVVATCVGLGLFVPAALLSMADYPDSVEEAWELFVLAQARTVYERPLGDL